MATLTSFVESPNPVPSGSTGNISLTFTTAPPQGNLTADISVFENGIFRGNATGVVLSGSVAEVTPDVQIGATNTGWEIRTTQGVLKRVSQNQFTISRT